MRAKCALLTLPTTLVAAALVCLGAVACGDDPLERRVSDDQAPPGDVFTEPNGCVADSGTVAARYRVRKGDTLSGIALRIYGDADLWREIAHANTGRVGENGELRAGDELVIPFDGR